MVIPFAHSQTPQTNKRQILAICEVISRYFGEELKKMGMNIINDDITGRVHKDRKLLTGDSPFAANALGKLAAQEMLAAYAG